MDLKWSCRLRRRPRRHCIGGGWLRGVSWRSAQRGTRLDVDREEWARWSGV